MKAGMDAWMEWAAEAGDAVVDLGSPLGRGSHLDGSQVTSSKTDLAGYSILQADSLDDVVPENSVDVLPMLAMPGM